MTLLDRWLKGWRREQDHKRVVRAIYAEVNKEQIRAAEPIDPRDKDGK